MAITFRNIFSGLKFTMKKAAFDRLSEEAKLEALTAQINDKTNLIYERSKKLVESKYALERLINECPEELKSALNEKLERVNKLIEEQKVQVEQAKIALQRVEVKKAEVRARLAINEVLRPIDDTILGTGNSIDVDAIFKDLDDFIDRQEDEVNAILEVQSWTKASK